MGDRLRCRLRCRDDQHLRLRQELRKRHRDVAGAGRQVDQQVVECAPVDVLQELLDRLVEHRAAPDHCGVVVDEEADRHDLDSAGRVDRQDLARLRNARAPRHAQHARDAVTPDVGVEGGRGVPLEREGGREVRGHGRLAHTPLTGRYADHVLDLRERAFGEPVAPELLLEPLLLLGGEHVEPDVHVLDSLQLRHRLRDGLLKVAADRAPRRSERHGHVHGAVRQLDRADHLQLDDRPPELRVDHRAQLFDDLFSGRHEDGD
jgi:hypothetical protein